MDIAKIRRAISYAATMLSDRKEEVNRLNVFPVPDGDTGTNMSLTMDSVVREVEALPANASGDDLRRAITHGSLMGARGNSGVITSQILRGICEGLEDAQVFDTATMAAALKRSVEVAFQAVRKPVKGTILTVLEDAAAAAEQAADANLSLPAALQAISDEALASVKRTSDFLPVLKENGVVDSGGFGLTILFQGFVVYMLGGGEEKIASSKDFTSATGKVAIEQVNDWAGSKFMYCTEFLFHSATVDTEKTLEFLADMGDCELLVGTHPDFKVHVHTDTPGKVLNYMTDQGQISEVFIHNMVLESQDRAQGMLNEDEQSSAFAGGQGGAGGAQGSAGAQGGAQGSAAGNGVTQSGAQSGVAGAQNIAQNANSQHKPLAYVAVSVGSGVAAILKSLGVDLVIEGGQTMNPSTADLLSAIEAANADSVIILPNNKNIIMAANAAVQNADIPCEVVPTKNVLSAFSAMFVADKDASLQENVEEMTQALDGVHCGEITTAVKDSKTSGGQKIFPNDVIGIADGSLDAVGKTVEDVAFKLLESMDAPEFDTLTLLAGVDYDDEQMDALVEKIEEKYPDLDIDAQRGEQPLYPLFFSLE